jgi:hypothetical protein
MPNDDMWSWITSPLVGVQKKNTGTTTQAKNGSQPDSLRMRKGPDLTVHRLPGADDDDNRNRNRPDGVPAMPPVSRKEDDDKDTRDVGSERARNLDKEEQDKREKEREASKQPVKDRMTDAAKEALKKYAEDNLGKLKEEALDRLAKAWKESPGGVIAAGAILGAAGATYLVKTGADLPAIPAIPLDFLAKRAPIFKGAELNIEVKGPITGPESIMVKITFHEGGGKDEKKGAGKGKVFTLRMNLKPGSAKAASPETGADIEIEGQISIPSDAKPEDVTATTKAIKDAKIEVMVLASPTYTVKVLSVEDNYIPDKMGLKPPPTVRYLTVRLKTAMPPMFHQGKDEVIDAPVRVEMNHVGSEGEAKVKAHFQPFPAKK